MTSHETDPRNINERLEARLSRIETLLESILELVDDPPTYVETAPGSLAPEPRDTMPAPPVRCTYQRVAKGFNYYYEQRLQLAWHYGPHVQALEDIALWVDKQANISGRKPDAVLNTLLKHFFADEYARKAKYPPKLLAAQAARYYHPQGVPVEKEPDAEAINMRRQREAEQRHNQRVMRQLEETERNASRPPPLDELVNGLMEKWG